MTVRCPLLPLALVLGLASPAAAQTLWVATDGDDGSGDVFVDGFESGDTAPWSGTVP